MGQHQRNGLSLLAKQGELPPKPPQSMVDLQQLAALRALACPTCRRDGTQTPLFAVGVGPGVHVLFCVNCLLPKLAELTPPMVPTAQLPPAAPADGEV